MIHTLEINGFRGFKHFTMSNLGRVNLLVGANNCGKTSVLEALYILASQGDLFALARILSDRGERQENAHPGPDEGEFEICHLFHGHQITNGGRFTIAAKNTIKNYSITFAIRESSIDDLDNDDHIISSDLRLSLSISGDTNTVFLDTNLTSNGGIPTRRTRLRGDSRRNQDKGNIQTQYISTGSLSTRELYLLWNSIALTEHEDNVLEALQIIEPRIDRIAALTTELPPFLYRRGGFKIKLKDTKAPLPIGNLGDGAWRMLAIAMALNQAKDGILLIDEIDSGLHYSTLEKIWRLIFETAKKLNVQVFATTHSQDCVEGLAIICRNEINDENQVSIQRIESKKKEAVFYTEEEIKIAAKRHIEVR
ncbi:Chromosome segregation protein SMC [Azospirillaceae bacterium]